MFKDKIYVHILEPIENASSLAFYPSNIFLQCRTISLALKTDVEFSKRLHKQTNLSLLHYQLGSTSKEIKRADDLVKSNQ